MNTTPYFFFLFFSLFLYYYSQPPAIPTVCDPYCNCNTTVSNNFTCIECKDQALNYYFKENHTCLSPGNASLVDKKKYCEIENKVLIPCNQCDPTVSSDNPLCGKCHNDNYTFTDEQGNVFCYTYPRDGFYKINQTLHKCFAVCTTCNQEGEELYHNCESCIENYGLIEDQPGMCLLGNQTIPRYYYDVDAKWFLNCFEKCYRCLKDGVYSNQTCTSCENGDFFIHKGGTRVDNTYGNCLNPYLISKGQFVDDISIFFPEENQPFNETTIESGLYIYHIDSYLEQNSIHNFIPMFNLDNVLEAMKETYSINSLDDLIIAQSLKNVSNIVTVKSNYTLYLRDGTKLDLTLMIPKNVSFTVIFPINFNKSDISFDYAKEMAANNIDIYNPKDNLYHTPCRPFAKDNKDLSLLDRRYIIFPNVTLCQPGCLYQGMLFDNYAINCSCYFDLTVKRNNSFTKDIESNNNFPLFTCISLYYNIKITDFIVIYAISLMSVQLLVTIAIIFTYRRNINHHLKSTLSNPPKKNKEVQKLPFQSIDDNSEISRNQPKVLIDDDSINQNTNSLKQTKSIMISSMNSFAQVQHNKGKGKDKPKRAKNEDNKYEQTESEMDSSKSSNNNSESLDPEDKEEEENESKDNNQIGNEVRPNSSKRNHSRDEFQSSERQINEDIQSPSNINAKNKHNPMNTNISSIIQQNTLRESANLKDNSSFASSFGFDAQWKDMNIDEYNIAPLNVILHIDKCQKYRYWKYFCFIFFERQMIFTLFYTKNMFYPFALRLFVFIYNYITMVFFTALLYSPDYLTQRFLTTSKLDFVYIIVDEWTKSLYAAFIVVLTSKVYYIVVYCNVKYSRINDRDKAKNSTMIYYLLVNYRIRVILLIVLLFILMIGCFYFIILFCLFYPNNVISLIHSSIFTMVLYIPVQCALCLLYSFIRFVGIDNELKFAYLLSVWAYLLL